MHIYVDDQPFAVGELGSKTIRDIAQEVRDSLVPQGRMVVAIFVNGQSRPVPPAEIEATLDSPASKYERVDFQSAPPQTLAREVLRQARALVAEASPTCQQAGELLSAGQTARAMELLGNCFGVWSTVQESMTKSVQLLGLDLSKMEVSGQPAEQLLQQFAEQLRQVKEALENRDYVQLADILQYELQEVAPRWQGLLDRLVQQIEEL